MTTSHKGQSAGKTHATPADLQLIVEGNYEERTVKEWVELALSREAELLKLQNLLNTYFGGSLI